MAAFWAVFTFGGSGPALTAHGSFDLKQEIQIHIFLVLSLTRGAGADNIGISAHYFCVHAVFLFSLFL
jgi:hypothetical protein